jgi:hypothetical protein
MAYIVSTLQTESGNQTEDRMLSLLLNFTFVVVFYPSPM